VDVLREILEWSPTRPAWQRDALRRLVTQGELSNSDLQELTELCKAAHGLAENHGALPLEERHIPVRGAGFDPVRLTSLTHHSGVNALAPGQTIGFGPQLTVVFGRNAAGKSGYTRILKRACRARGTEAILGNVLAGAAPLRPSATVRFALGDEEHELAWADREETHHALGRVSVFDSHCAAVYLGAKTDVAFRPFGLDLFDKLSKVCEDVRGILDKERRTLEARRITLPELPEGTAARRLVSSITSLTKPEDVISLATLTAAEKEQMRQARKRLQDLQTDDPVKVSRSLTLRAQRLEKLGSYLGQLAEVLDDKAVRPVFEMRAAVEAAAGEADKLRGTTFSADLLPDTGSSSWRDLWEAARDFSSEAAYPNKAFPVTDEGARCVLCQQDLTEPAAQRLKRFEDFLRSNIQQQLERTEAGYRDLRRRLDNLPIGDESSEAGLEELQIENGELADSVRASITAAQQRRSAIQESLDGNGPIPEGLPVYTSHSALVLKEVQALRQRVSQLARNGDKEARRKLIAEESELRAREALQNGLEAVLEEIERKKELAAYSQCVQDVGTNAITRKSTEVTKQAVTDQLAKSFQGELVKLRFDHLEVELQAAGGARGTLYHRLVLTRAASANLPRIVSEGEARSLSIAAFFSELSTATDRSAILFDDPVSSLDHDWRENVARRLAEEARIRQVVVFTHDLVFLVALSKYAEEWGVECRHQYLRRQGVESGVCSPELPWVAMPVKRRIRALRDKWQRAEKLHRTVGQEDYEREAIDAYGMLREAWERGVEEVLLNGIVQRYRASIETLRARSLPDITEEDCNALEAGMSKSSRWLRGHDQAPAEHAPIPGPTELKEDIEALDRWVTTIEKRRKK